jgi:chromosome segregation ATPase
MNRFFNTILFLFLASVIVAQSDYRITQEFKSRQRSFEIAIEYAKTNEELSKIKKEINEFRNEFKGNKELLNRALYPSNFVASFTTLDKKIEYTNKRLAEISQLQTKVTKVVSDYEKISNELQKLTNEVNSLRNSNSRLMSELKAFKSGYGGSKNQIDSLRNLVTQLKNGIAKRDTLLKEIMDNIFMTAEHKIESLDEVERKSLQTRIKSTSLIDNIRNLINDNIEFLDASIFNPEDLSALKSEFSDFDQRWSHFGPKLFDIYSADTLNKDKLIEIDTLIYDWNSSLELSSWRSVDEVFSSHNIELNDFTNGEEFKESILSYIDNQISNDGNIEVSKDKDYIFFADRVWNDIIKPYWIPLLISEDLITTDQLIAIEDKVEEWKDSSGGSKSYFIYGIIILLALIIIASLYFISKKKRKTKLDNIDILEEEDEKKDLAIDEDEEFIDDNK